MVFQYLLIVLCLSRSSFALPSTTVAVPTEHKGWDSLFGNNVTSLIQLLHNGQKSYYFSFYFKANYFQAAQFCEDIHMKLVSIESLEENTRIYKYVRDANKGELFWTSGSKLLDGKHWVWMSKGQPIEYTNWAPGNPDSQTEYCMAAYHSKNVGLTWADRDCLVTMGFICERRNGNNYPNADNELIDWNSIYENPYISPNVPLFHTKTKSYFLGRYFKATFQEAIQLCTMMKMELVAITSEEENERIYKYIRDTNAGDTFWTSGTRMIDGTTWVWMSNAQLVDYTKWYTGQPDTVTDHCIQLLAQKDKGLFWADSNCALRFSYICEKPREIFPVYQKPFVTRQQSIESSDNFPISLVQMENGIYYIGTQFKLTQFEASQFCQYHQMELISITTEEENEEIRQLLLHHSPTTGSFWTSARRASEEDKWTWSTGKLVTYSNFKFKYSSGKNPNCIEILSNATWIEKNCNVERFFICEKINGATVCPKLAPILNIHVNNDSTSKNFSMPYGFFKVDNATFDVGKLYQDQLEVV